MFVLAWFGGLALLGYEAQRTQAENAAWQKAVEESATALWQATGGAEYDKPHFPLTPEKFAELAAESAVREKNQRDHIERLQGENRRFREVTFRLGEAMDPRSRLTEPIPSLPGEVFLPQRYDDVNTPETLEGLVRKVLKKDF
ncbi:MAG: hypothetical protein A3J09_02170 [Candidatus Zambryskibacteria bacterium RIFCSPLOWO2_02_FULL_51_21]|nr:MAG: hypothetical protein A3J09_02170 [Candidatus Zambryskibacteria bacterium RIFCSPLOWO2_02_FULL_51_21]